MNSPLSILFLIPSLASRGAERVLVNLVNNLDKNRFRVTLQTLFDVGELRQELSSEIEYRGGLPFVLRGYVQLMKLFAPEFLYKTIIRKRYDIVVAYLEGAVTRIVSGCPYPDSRKVAWVHIEQHTMPVVSYCYRNAAEVRWCYQHFDRVVAVSQTVRSDIESLLPVHCDVLYNINEEDKVRALSVQLIEEDLFSSDFNLISVGKLDAQKGFDRLIRVHAHLVHDGISNHLYLVGSGPQESALQRIAAELGVSATVHFLGYQSNPYKFVSRADLFVCSSRSEGFSTAVTEALILGRPVVSTRCSGAEELLGCNEEYGIVTDNDEVALYEGIRRMLTNPDLLSHYQNQAKESSIRFSKASSLSKIESFFTKDLVNLPL